jgi:hypothetical protein
MPTYAQTAVEDIDGVEQFLTDDRPVEVTDNVTRRMMNPGDCMDRLNRLHASREDLLVEGTDGLNLQIDPGSESLFSIAPDIDDGLGLHVRQHGAIPLSKRAVNQVAGLMDVKGGYKRYQKMGDQGPRHFLADFASFFRNRRTDDYNLLFRTIDRGTGREVEGVMRDDIDRTDTNRFVAEAMRSVIERYGSIIRGVEVFESVSQGGMEFRMLFGNPFMREAEDEPTKRLYTMLNISTSDTRVFMPRMSLGVWRMWCANGCTTQMFSDTAFRMTNSSTFEDAQSALDQMASVAFPYAGLLGSSLQELQHRPIGGDSGMSAFDVLGVIRDAGDLNEAFYDRCHDLGKDAYADDELVTEWDVFNLMTDAAKGLGSMSARRNAEDKALSFALYEGGITGVAERGFNKGRFERDMTSRIAEFVKPHANNDRSAMLAAAPNN